MKGLGAVHTLQHICGADWIFEDSTAISCFVFCSLGVADAFKLQNWFEKLDKGAITVSNIPCVPAGSHAVHGMSIWNLSIMILV